MPNTTATLDALRLIEKHAQRTSQPLLVVCYGPQAKPLRAAIMTMLLGRKVTGSDKAVQWGNFRKAMWEMVGAEGDCIASKEHDFETKAARILA